MPMIVIVVDIYIYIHTCMGVSLKINWLLESIKLS